MGTKATLIDLIGQKFGLLTVEKRAASNGRLTMWWVTCDCGNRTTARSTSLRNGDKKSCGCLLKASRDRYAKKLIIRNKSHREFTFSRGRQGK